MTAANGASGGAGNGHANAPTFLESRRFRTWESDTYAQPANRWGVVLRYAVLRTLRTWYLSGLLALVAINTVVSIAVFSYDASNGTQVDLYYAALAAFSFAPALFLLLVGAPLLAEDVRFNAPLFYFSRPLRTADYLLGKCMHLFGIVVATGLVPLLLVSVMVVAIGVQDVSPTEPWSGDARTPDEMRTARIHAVDTLPDALYAGFFTVVGGAACLFFLTSAMVLCSAYTRRAWHAAMAFVATLGSWSLLGAFATELLRGAWQNLAGPAGWMYLAVIVPLEKHFTVGGQTGQGWEARGLEGAWGAIPLAYLFLVGAGALCLWAANRRIQRLEALL